MLLSILKKIKSGREEVDMSQVCSQGYKPKTGPQRTQKENIPKQKKYKYFTSLKL